MAPLMPKVMMMGGTPAYATPNPFRRPTTTPATKTRGITHVNRAVTPLARLAVTRAAPARTDGIDRSIPPVSMHSVWPTPTKPVNEAVMRIVRMCCVTGEISGIDAAEEEQDGRHHKGQQDGAVAAEPARPRLSLCPGAMLEGRIERDRNDEDEALEENAPERGQTQSEHEVRY